MLTIFDDIWIDCTSDWSGSCSEEVPLFKRAPPRFLYVTAYTRKRFLKSDRKSAVSWPEKDTELLVIRGTLIGSGGARSSKEDLRRTSLRLVISATVAVKSQPVTHGLAEEPFWYCI